MATSEPQDARVSFECVVPILRVRELETSLEHYMRVLGFVLDWRQGGMAGVSRDGRGLMLCEGDQGQPGTWVWVGVNDAARLWTEYTASGAKLRRPPRNYPWAYELQVEDPDGHVLRFGSEPRGDLPFDDWL